MLRKNSKFSIFLSCIFIYAVTVFASPCQAKLQAQDFNALYRAASNRRIDIIARAMSRGLDIDSINRNGDTGMCVAIRNNDKTAYKIFTHFGAEQNHSCILRIPQYQYSRFMESVSKGQIPYMDSASSRYASLPVKNRFGPYKNNLYKSSWLKSPITWTIGGVALVAGGIAAGSGGGGGGKKGIPFYANNSTNKPTTPDNPDIPPTPDVPEIDFDLSTLSGVGGDYISPQNNIEKNIVDSEDASIDSLWAVYADENKDIANTADITLTADDSTYNKEHWGAIYAKNGYIYNAGIIQISSPNKYAAGLMACVIDSYTINTACFTNDDNPLGGDVYNEGDINISAHQSYGIFTGNTQNITNTGTIYMNGNDNTGIFIYGNANKITNSGSINLEGDVSDYYAGSMNGIWVSKTADITNTGSIDIQNYTYVATGIYTNDGTITNEGNINIEGAGSGIKTHKGTLINKGTINIENINNKDTYGMKVDTTGTAINKGEITIHESGYGIYTETGEAINDTDGVINIVHTPGQSSNGYAIASNGTAVNNGIINSTSGGMFGPNITNNNQINSDYIAMVSEGTAINTGIINSSSHAFLGTKNGSFDNSGTINSKLGIYNEFGNIINSGELISNNTAINTFSGNITNSGSIVSQQGVGLEVATSSIINNENANITINGPYGIYSKTKTYSNEPEKETIYKSNLTFKNDGNFYLTNGGTGIYMEGDEEKKTTPTLKVNNSGLFKIENQNNYSSIVGFDSSFLGSTSTIINSGDILIDNRKSNINNNITGIVIDKGTIENSGTLKIFNNKYTDTTDKNVIGIKIGEGTAINTVDGNITISSNNAIGMLAEYSGDPSKLEDGDIKAHAINEGTIELIGQNNVGLYAKNKGSAITNKGTIIIREENLTEPYVKYGDTVYSETDTCNSFICLENGGMYINAGTMASAYSLDFNTFGGRTLLSSGSKIEAPSISGDVYANYDLVTDNFDNVVVEDDSLVGDTSKLSVNSLSALYSARIVPSQTEELIENKENIENTASQENIEETENTSEITSEESVSPMMLSSPMRLTAPPSLAPASISHGLQLTRKSFHEFTTNSSVAEYLENNYALGNNITLYNDLKKTSTSEGIGRKIEQHLGLKLFPNFSKQVLNNLRNINSDVTSNLASNDDDRDVRSIIGINSHYRTQDNTKDLYGYEDRLQSVYGIIDKKYNQDLRLGFGINYAKSITKYDENNKSKTNILHIFAPFMYNNSTYKLISSPHFGYIWGSYNRHTDATSFKGDTKSWYYGLTNELSRDIALEHFILEPNLEFNIAGLYNDTIKDEQGLNVNSHNDISAEIGIGLYIKKRLEFAKKRSLSMRVGGGTYLELLNPYKTLKGSIPGMMGSYNFNKMKNNRNRSVLKTSIKYKQNNLDLIGELNKYIEDTDGYEVNVNMQYNLDVQ